MLLKDSPRPQLAHAYVTRGARKRLRERLEDNYGWQPRERTHGQASSDLLNALQLTNPRAVAEPNATRPRHPAAAVYAKAGKR